MSTAGFPEKVRVSTGSAIMLGLLSGRLDAKPTTAYLLMCRKDKCSANCGFCPQARGSSSRADLLSRVTWPIFSSRKVVDGIEKAVKCGDIQRVCIQTLNYPEAFDDVFVLVKEIKTQVAISVSCKPLKHDKMKALKDVGVNRISIALDAATKEIFERVKGRKIGGPYSWETQCEALKEAVKVFGRDCVSTHLIVGLKETEKELCQIIQWCIDTGVYPGMFAFTPIPGTALEKNPKPTLTSFRRIQLLHYILTHGKSRIENIQFDDSDQITDFGVSKEELLKIIETGEPFRTSGCSGCNRPYYNERPSGPFYNFPRPLRPEEIEDAKKVLGL